MSPGVPQDVRPLSRAPLCIFRRAIEVCQATLIEPPPCVVVVNAAALHRAVANGAGRIAAVIVYIRGAERSRVLVLFLVVASKCITCTKNTEIRARGTK